MTSLQIKETQSTLRAALIAQELRQPHDSAIASLAECYMLGLVSIHRCYRILHASEFQHAQDVSEYCPELEQRERAAAYA